jgi:hypothetical protein
VEDRKGASGSRANRRVLSAVKWLGAAAVAALLLHAAAARWLLSTTTLRRWINTSPETTWIDWDEATSFWPGRVRVRGVRIRGRDANVQWIFRLEEGRLRYSVPELLARRFHVERLDVDGLSFRLRKNRRSEDPRPTPVGLLPPILGFADPPRAPTEPPGPPRNPWTVRVEGISIERISEIWVDLYRFQGSARLTGRFRLRPGLEAEVGPAEILLSSGRVRLGAEPVVKIEESRLACRIEEWDPRILRGDAVWKNISGQVDVSGPVERIDFVNYFLRASSTPRLSGGSGRVRIQARIERGVARGEVALDAGGLGLQTAVSRLSGDARLLLRVARWDLANGPLDFSGSRIGLSRVGSEPDGSRGWWGRFDFRSGQLGRALEAKIVLQCEDARPILSAAGAAIPKLARGVLKLEGLRGSGTIRASRGRAEIRDLDVTGGTFHVQGDFRQVGHRQDAVFLLDAGKVNVGVAVRAGRTRLRPIATRRWFDGARRSLAAGETPTPSQPARSTTTAVP